MDQGEAHIGPRSRLKLRGEGCVLVSWMGVFPWPYGFPAQGQGVQPKEGQSGILERVEPRAGAFVAQENCLEPCQRCSLNTF